MTVLPTPTTPFYGGGQVANPANVIATVGVPPSKFTEDRVGTLAVDNAAGNIYGLASKSGGVDSWVLLGGSSGAIASVLGTANQITVNTVGNVATVSLPAAITAPGSITTTTTLTGGTGVTATTGNVTASAGNLVAAGTGNGVVVPVSTASGASPQTANARAFAVTFSGVSIAAGATQSFVIANSTVNTQALISMAGATTGAALNIQSITYSANTSITIVVENGTGATTSIANITFTGICLN